MSRTKEEVRANRQKKIDKRRRLLTHLDYTGRANNAEDGYFANSGEVSKYTTAGKSRKTKAKNGYASYRHKGAYGAAVDYKPRDRRQIDRMETDINDA